LPSLATECNQLTAILEAAAKKGLCELVVRPYATVDQILSTFEQADLRGRLAVFHYAGHANSYELLLEGPDGDIALAHAGGLTAFLRHQRGLQLIFLNACSTQAQVQGLLDAGVNVVLATSQDINDQIATAFANHFYTFLVNLDTIEIAFAKAQAAVHTRHGGDTRHLYSPNTPVTTTTNGWPWDLYQRPDAIAASRWTLGDAATTRLLPFEPETVLIPAGPFLMGSMPGPGVAQHETPQHTVVLPAYRIGKYPVTNRQYLQFVRQCGIAVAPEAGWILAPLGQAPLLCREDHPIVGVTWDETMAYCRWLSESTGRRYRLAGEAEWEKAARGADGRRYPWGSEFAAGYCQGGLMHPDGTAPVGSFSPAGDSPYGCVDMVGNVWEWTNTQWGRNRAAADYSYPYRSDDGRERSEPVPGPYRELRICRGGSFCDPAERLTCSTRTRFVATSRHIARGFRVVMEV
jgi:formylglycine-generating enzyme required for sulfatase activity